MIDQGVFKNEWALLCERFRMTSEKAPSQPQMKRYYRYLSERMDTETFQRAAEIVWAQREFFPRPVDFVEAVDAGDEVRALEQWKFCQRLMSGDRSALEEMDEQGRQVVDLMGGISELRRTKIDETKWRRREFLKLYRTATEGDPGARSIEPMTAEGRKTLEAATEDTDLLGAGR